MCPGNVNKVEADAEKIAHKLRTTDITLKALMAEYHCAYKTIIKVVHSQIPFDEYKQLRRKRLIKGGIKTRFKKGCSAWNKGKSYHAGGRSVETQFKKGHLRGQAARNYRPIGTITIRYDKLPKRLRHRKRKEGMPPWSRKSRRWIKIKDTGLPQYCWVPYARWIWERENGSVPDGFFIIHKDGNQLNDNPDNLVLIDHATNLRRNAHNPQVRKIAHKLAVKSRKKNTRERRKLRIFLGRQISQWDCIACGASYNQENKPERCIKCGNTCFEKNFCKRKIG